MKVALGILLLAVIGPHLCRANLNGCRNVAGFTTTPLGTSSYLGHTYSTVGGVPGTCQDPTLVCNATVPINNLRDRSWYIDNTRTFFGYNYPPSYVQVYNIQCPVGTLLHMLPVTLDTERAVPCTNGDFVSVDSQGIDQPILLCGGEDDLLASDLYNGGFGTLFDVNNATVEFCSNDNAITGRGFAIKATCVDPAQSFLPGCVDYDFTLASDREFVERINPPFAAPEKVNILHKRSIEDLPEKEAEIVKLLQNGGFNRNKRFINEFLEFELNDENDKVTYSGNKLTVELNGVQQEFDVTWLVAINDLIGNRIFDINLPVSGGLSSLCGPGKVFVFGSIAHVEYTIDNIASLLIPNAAVSRHIFNIANYTYQNYLNPYPVVDESVVPQFVFPLPSGSTEDVRYRSVFTLGFLQEDIQSGTCRRAVLIQDAPARDSVVDSDILAFCRFFYYSCNVLLSSICRETIELDRQSG